MADLAPFHAGYEARHRGLMLWNNPQPKGSLAHLAWLEGWFEADEDLNWLPHVPLTLVERTKWYEDFLKAAKLAAPDDEPIQQIDSWARSMAVIAEQIYADAGAIRHAQERWPVA